jgi:hypothetical protein
MLTNATPLAVLAAPLHDVRGVDVVAILAKATFVRRGAELTLADAQIPVRVADVPTDPSAVKEGRESSVRYPSDVGLEKPGADVIVVGHAISARRVSSLEVAVRAATRKVSLRVHGERLFYKSGVGVKVGPGAPFERAPITYERAYGGMSADRSIVDWRNPAGRGVHRSVTEIDGAPAPSIEDPAAPIEGAKESVPVGFGAIASWWLPRRALAGTMDAAWQAERMPLPPLDFDPRFHHVAHPSLQIERPLRAGDVLATHGLSPEGLFQVSIPALAPVVHLRRKGAPKVTLPLVLDTALLEPELDRVELTYRRIVPLGRGATLLEEARLDAD